MKRIGLIARADKSGLGIGQTLRLARLLNPSKVMLIDSTTFNGHEQFPSWYDKYDVMTINGFPNTLEIAEFVRQVDVVITAETFYSHAFVQIARSRGVKTICIFNWEFMDQLRNPFVELPDVVATPSHWHYDTMKARFNAVYLPTPIFKDEFAEARKVNLKRKGKPRYLFINGKAASMDRNGLESVYEALRHAKGDFSIVIKSQGVIERNPDPRLIYDFSNPVSQVELYTDFDMMIMPRRYGGQCLPMTEALQSALPVIMTDIEPNNKVLPPSWLVPATKTGELMTRVMIDVYSADPGELAKILDNPDCGKDAKKWAYQVGQQYSSDKLKVKYEEVIT